MKKICLTLFCLGLFTITYAQKFLPEIKKGTILSCNGYRNGQEFPLVLTVNSLSGPASIGWAVEGYGDGSFEMTDKALDSATKMGGAQPSQGATKLADDETFGVISKAAYKAMIDTKTLTYNGTKFKVKAPDTNPMKIDGKELDVTHVISEDGKIEYWILNNAAFPLIMQSAGRPIDIVVNAIK